MKAYMEAERAFGPIAGGARSTLAAPQPGQTMYRVVRVNERPAGGDLNNAGQVAFSEFTEDGRFILKFYDGNATIDIGTLGGPGAFVTDLSNSGQFTGASNVDERTQIFHAFRWSRTAGLVDLGVPAGYDFSMGMAINDSGQVAGFAQFEQSFGSAALLWDPQAGMRDLGNLGFPWAMALGLNNAGRVMGNSLTAEGVGMAFSWTRAEGMIGLLPPGAFGSEARDINASGQIVGNFFSELGNRMFLWTPGRGFETIEGPPAFPFALSDTGWIAGVLMDQRAFVWHRSLGMVDIGILPGGGFSNAYDVNNRGQVVGDSTTADSQHAFLWTPVEGLVDLNDRLLNPPPAELQGARHINDNGVILAGTSAGLVLLFPQAGGAPAPIIGPINGAGQVRSGESAAYVARLRTFDLRTAPHAHWSWGDGSESAGVVAHAHGEGTVSGTHTYAASGSYTVVLTVVGANGQRRSVSRTVQVV